MIDLKELNPIPHPAKDKFKQHNIPLSAICKAAGRSYSYMCSILAGHLPAPPELDKKLHELAASLEKEVRNE